MSETQWCEYCSKKLDKSKGEIEHGCIDCSYNILLGKCIFLQREIKEKDARIAELQTLHLNLLQEITDLNLINDAIGLENSTLIVENVKYNSAIAKLKEAIDSCRRYRPKHEADNWVRDRLAIALKEIEQMEREE